MSAREQKNVYSRHKVAESAHSWASSLDMGDTREHKARKWAWRGSPCQIYTVVCPKLVVKTKYIDTLIKLLLTVLTYLRNKRSLLPELESLCFIDGKRRKLRSYTNINNWNNRGWIVGLEIFTHTLSWFAHNIRAIMAKIKLPKNPHSMVIFWIKVRRSYQD